MKTILIFFILTAGALAAGSNPVPNPLITGTAKNGSAQTSGSTVSGILIETGSVDFSSATVLGLSISGTVGGATSTISGFGLAITSGTVTLSLSSAANAATSLGLGVASNVTHNNLTLSGTFFCGSATISNNGSFGNDGTTFANDGSAVTASGNMQWDSSGRITATSGTFGARTVITTGTLAAVTSVTGTAQSAGNGKIIADQLTSSGSNSLLSTALTTGSSILGGDVAGIYGTPYLSLAGTNKITAIANTSANAALSTGSSSFLLKASNLSDVPSPVAARANLGGVLTSSSSAGTGVLSGTLGSPSFSSSGSTAITTAVTNSGAFVSGTGASAYIFPTFFEGGNGYEQLMLGFCLDTGTGQTLKSIGLLSGSGVYTASSGGVRDPSMVLISGTYFVAHTAGSFGNVTYVTLLTSTDAINYSFLTNVTTNAGASQSWAPELFVDGSGVVHMYFGVSTDSAVTMSIYHTQATNAALTSWSTPVAITGTGLPSKVLDPFRVDISGTTFLVMSSASTCQIYTSITGTDGFAAYRVGTSLGWGTKTEGESVTLISPGVYRAVIDAYGFGGSVCNTPGLWYSDSTDGALGTWTSPKLITTTNKICHGTPCHITDFATIWRLTGLSISNAATTNGFRWRTDTLEIGTPFGNYCNISQGTLGSGLYNKYFQWTMTSAFDYQFDVYNGSGDSGFTSTALAYSRSSPKFTFYVPQVGTSGTMSLGMWGTKASGDASAGYIGEILSGSTSSGSPVSLTNATGTNVTSASLTSGDWDVTGVVDYVTTGATTTDFKSGISTTSATFGSQDTFSNMPLIATALSDTFGHVAPTVRVSLGATTTVYLVGQSNFSIGTASAYGTIRARRVR